jgi:hypothetical protein
VEGVYDDRGQVMNFPTDDERHRLRRQRTLQQLQRVCARLEALLSGQDAGVAEVELPQDKRPGETPVERLQRYRRRLNEVLGCLQRGEALRCERCARALPDLELDETPWATRCRACSD